MDMKRTVHPQVHGITYRRPALELPKPAVSLSGICRCVSIAAGIQTACDISGVITADSLRRNTKRHTVAMLLDALCASGSTNAQGFQALGYTTALLIHQQPSPLAAAMLAACVRHTMLNAIVLTEAQRNQAVSHLVAALDTAVVTFKQSDKPDSQCELITIEKLLKALSAALSGPLSVFHGSWRPGELCPVNSVAGIT